MGRVRGIYIAPDKGQPMESVLQVEAIEGQGLDGDRYKEGKGAWSTSRVEAVRDVSLIAFEAIEEANQTSLAPSFSPEETRRNILTTGVDLNALVGYEFWVGTVKMFGTELCDPCKRPSALASKPGFEKAFENRGGLRARILNSGTIAVGDDIRL